MLIISMMFSVPGTAFSVFPYTENETLKVNAGVDMDALLAGNVYFGSYAHLISYDKTEGYGDGTNEEAPTPVLWIPMGEEKDEFNIGDGKLTFMSHYVLDTEYNSRTKYNQARAESLNQKFGGAFNTSEQVAISPTDVITKQFNSITGEALSLFTVNANQKLYIPWGVERNFGDDFTNYSLEYYWSAKGPAGKNYFDDTYKFATLKSGESSLYWQRNNQNGSDYYTMTFPRTPVPQGGSTNYQWQIMPAFNNYGQRPIFKMDPDSIIFAEAITSSNALYQSSTNTRQNYKLTVLQDEQSTLSVSNITLGGKPVKNAVLRSSLN